MNLSLEKEDVGSALELLSGSVNTDTGEEWSAWTSATATVEW